MSYQAWKRPARHRRRPAVVPQVGGEVSGRRQERADRRATLASYYTAGLLLLAAVWVFRTAHDDLVAAQRVASQPLSTAAQVAQVPAGQPVVVVGRIDARTALADESRGLTMYADWERLQKSPRIETRRVAPPFDLDLADGPLRIANDGYALRSLPAEALTPGGGTRRGLGRGDAVVVVGTTVDGGMVADAVAGGSPAAYSSALRTEGLVSMLVGVAAIAVAIVAGGLGLGRWRRG